MEDGPSVKPSEPEGNYISSNYDASQAARQGNQSLRSEGISMPVSFPQDGERAFKAISEGKAESTEPVMLENKAASLLSTGLSQLGSYSSGSDSEEAEDSKAGDEAYESKLSEKPMLKQDNSKSDITCAGEVNSENSVNQRDSTKVLNIAEEAMECTENLVGNAEQSEKHETDVTKLNIGQDRELETSETNNDQRSEKEDSKNLPASLSTDQSHKRVASSDKSVVSEMAEAASGRTQRSESTGFEVQGFAETLRKPSKVEMIDEESNSSFIKLDNKMKDSPQSCDVPPSPYEVSEMSETPGPPTPASVMRYIYSVTQ